MRFSVLFLVIVFTGALTLFSLVRTPSVQVLAGRLAARYLSDQYNIHVYIDKLRITDRISLQLDGLQLFDHHGKPILEVDELRVRLNKLSLDEHVIGLGNVSLERGGFYLVKYPGDTLLNLDFVLEGFSSGLADTAEQVTAVWTIECDHLSLEEFSFGFTDQEKAAGSEGMDFNDLLITGIAISIKDISVIGDSVNARIEHLACHEKSGFSLMEFAAEAAVSASGIRTENLFISTNNSTLDLDLEFLYEDYSSLGYFLDSVYMNAEFRSSLLTLQDVGFFAPELLPMEDPVMFSGRVDGFISDFSAEEFSIKLGQFTEFSGDISMRGLPDFDATFTVLDIRAMTTHPADLAAFNLPASAGNLDLPPEIRSMGFTTLWGNYSGYPTHFRTRLDIRSDLGDVNLKANLISFRNWDSVSYAVDMTGKNIQLAKIFNTSLLGTTDLDIELEGSGTGPDDFDLTIAGWIENLVFKDHHYDRIIFGGEVLASSYNGRLFILDDALTLSFDGLVSFNEDQPKFDFSADLEKARFYEMNLSDKSRDMNLSGHITGDFTGTDPEQFLGNIRLNDMLYTENGQDYALENLEINRETFPGRPDQLQLRSDYADGDITGKFTFLGLVRVAESMILSRSLAAYDTVAFPGPPQFASLKFHLKDINPLFEIFYPSLSVDTGVFITGQIDEADDLLKVSVKTGGLSYSGIRFNEVSLTGETTNGHFLLDAGVRQVILQEENDTASLSLDNLNLRAETRIDSIFYSLVWDNHDSVLTNKAVITGTIRLPSGNRIEASITRADADFNGNVWSIGGGNQMIIDTNYLGISNLVVIKDQESLKVDGAWSRNPSDTLSLAFGNWSLANFDPLLKGGGVTLGGFLNGRLGVSRGDSLPNVFAAIGIRDFEFNEVYFGEAEINSRWIETDSSMQALVNIYSKGELTDRYRIIGISGSYYPFSDRQNFDFDISTQNLDISVLEPLISSFSSKVAGFATGKLQLSGTNDKPAVNGRLKLQRAELMVDYLGVTYSFSNEVVFSEGAIRFNELKVYDPFSNQAVLTGGILHEYFNDMKLDLHILPEAFLVVDLNRYQNEVFYGKAYASGEVSLTGPFNNLDIKVDVKTDKGTNIFIPISYSVDVSDTDFIIFVSELESDTMDNQDEVRLEGLSLDIGMNITRDADIQIFLPADIGFIKAAGAGHLRMGVDPNGYLTLNGSYVIQTGLFVFSLEQLVSRRFEILEGSSISWTGDINDAEVSITARYRLRTSLDGLGISMIDPDAAAQKVIVNTDIRMTGNLFNPELRFGISFPNMQEQTRQAVYAVLDTNDLGLMNQQAISLLVLGGFSSTGSSGSNPVNPAAIVSNTLSSMLSQISNDFNIGINYVPGDRVTDEQLEVALSTQLLDDRLIIDGNIDVSGSSASSQKTSAIVGDFNIEYKLTPDGRFRVKAFNRSNDLSLYTQYAPYTQGVGIFYRKEFNSIHDFFNRKRKDKTGEIDLSL